MLAETVFHTDDVPPGLGVDSFVERLSRSHAPMTANSGPGEDFAAHQRHFALGRLSVYTSEIHPLSVIRTPRLIRRSDPEMYHLSLITKGTVGLTIDDRDSLYGPLAMRTNESSRPFEIRLGTDGEAIEAVSVDLPKAVLPLPPARADRVIGRPLDGRGGVGALLAGFLTTLAAGTRSYTGADVPRLETVLTDLLATLFAHELDTLDALPAETRRHTLTLRIRSFIHQRLGDPELTPHAVAAAHHISVSQLHRIFREEAPAGGGPDTVMGYIRAQRLERARRDLADPALRTRSIGEIALRRGFTHHVVFTRAFRAAYGIAPRDYRHLELGDPVRSTGPVPPATGPGAPAARNGASKNLPPAVNDVAPPRLAT
ncbi:AraC-like ligand-binding domain-containing protein [Streptomyces zingiberis]|uniref:Helix-turn-helix domain-containing protein n=1 Tax=Streptomyces zingiberis TaxID=2053010 RepID=A0ABX1BRD5_9ACTN|nr:helix-turn-helix domain-containing protein [Streptomyces zingiberis]NJQ00300.1 helix-turn-helix domain-containing protein [Streptomyces zingiberis]